MLEVKKPASSNSKKNLKIKIPKENMSAPEISNESSELPVEIKQNEHVEDSEVEVNEESIQIQIRAGFIKKVYGILSIQLMITFGSVFLFQLQPIKKYIFNNQQLAGNILIVCCFTFLALFLILICNRNLAKTVPYNYIYLFAITLCESLACSVISSIYSFQIVATALALTIVSTLVITFYACTTKTNFSYYRMGMFILFSQIFMIGLIEALFRLETLYILYTFIMTIMVGFYLVYDTQLIIGKFGVAYSVDDYIFATLEIYMDIIRLFLLILRILGRARRN